MRRRVLLVIVAAIGIAVALLSAARTLTLLVDRTASIRVESAIASPIGWDGAALRIGARRFDLQAPDYTRAAEVHVDDGGRLVLTKAGQSFVLGSRAGLLPDEGDGGVPAFAAESGDETSFTVERSWLGWPTPFELNVMTGRSASWRRAVYYRLGWTKRSGAHLDMVWRYEQWFYDDWASPYMTRESWSGLARVDIRSAADARVR
jgi:hypothetical protein